MEALALFLWSRQVKRHTGNDVVNVPTMHTLIPPRHTGLEEGFDVSDEMLNRTSQKRHGFCSSSCTIQSTRQSRSQHLSKSILEIFSHFLALVGSLCCLGWLLFASLPILGQYPLSIYWVFPIALLLGGCLFFPIVKRESSGFAFRFPFLMINSTACSTVGSVPWFSRTLFVWRETVNRFRHFADTARFHFGTFHDCRYTNRDVGNVRFA